MSLFNPIEVQLIYSVVLISSIQQSDSLYIIMPSYYVLFCSVPGKTLCAWSMKYFFYRIEAHL